MRKLIDVEQLTYSKYLNMFQANYRLDSGKQYPYYIASRKQKQNLAVFGNDKTDAVRILPYIKENDKTYVILIKEFRHPLNRYIFSTPAGIIDENESSEVSAIRELEEEIGASVVKIERVQKKAYSSAGMTDESLECFEAEVKLDKKQNLEEIEDITFIKVELDDLLDFVDKNDFGLQSALHLKMFYYKNKYMEQKNGK